MKSPAPLFSKALFNKNLHRFWPLLAAYLFFILIASFGIITSFNHREIITSTLFNETIFNLSSVLAVVVASFSIALAVAIFSYMHNSVATAMVNTLPYKRKTVYISNYISGLFMLLIPLLVFFLVLVGISISFNCLDFIVLAKWLFIFTSLSILLYSLAVTIGMFTGHLVAHIVFFGIFNFLFVGLEMLINGFFVSYLYGFTNSSNYFLGMRGSSLAIKATPIVYAASETFQTALKGSLLIWLVYLLSSVLLIWLGLKLYEKRKMENAGDVIAIRKFNPIFKYGVTFCSSLAFGMILIEIFSIQNNFALSIFLFLLTGMAGYFIAEMLLRKSYRVLDAYKGFVVYALILIVLTVSIYNDWYGYATRMPDINKVEAVAFSDSWFSHYTINNLQAEKGRVYFDEIPNIPNSLALTYGVPKEKVENYSGGYRYIYDEPRNLSSEETKLLWSIIPGIYQEDESIANIYKLHTYLTKNIKEVRDNYRTRDTSKWYKEQEHNHLHFNISIIYRLDNGKVEVYNYPVLIPENIVSELDQELFNQLATIAGLEERRYKKANAIDIATKNISRITLSPEIMRYSEKYPHVDMPKAVTLDESNEIKIAPEDYLDLQNALKADYLSMSNKEMLRINYNNWGYIRVSIDNLDLPPNNKFRERSATIDIDFYNNNVLEFLHDKGYINDEFYNYIKEYRVYLDKQESSTQSYIPRISVA